VSTGRINWIAFKFCVVFTLTLEIVAPITYFKNCSNILIFQPENRKSWSMMLGHIIAPWVGNKIMATQELWIKWCC
jgi:hypothetical protein